ncbi:hypothetical protein GCM10025762_23440 [Haloechinothrix salitolerans]
MRGANYVHIVASLMLRWGISRQATVKALIDDGLATHSELRTVSTLSVPNIMRQSGLFEEWQNLSSDESLPCPSPILAERALEAYSRGWVSIRIVAELLGVTISEAEQQLQDQGWY